MRTKIYACLMIALFMGHAIPAGAVLQSGNPSGKAGAGSIHTQTSSEIITDSHEPVSSALPATEPAVAPQTSPKDEKDPYEFGYKKTRPASPALAVTPSFMHSNKTAASSNESK
jgi:hypothetical protein